MSASLGLDVIYKSVHDSAVKLVLKSKKSPIESFDAADGTIYQQVEIIKGHLESEAERKTQEEKRLSDSAISTGQVETTKTKNSDDDTEEHRKEITHYLALGLNIMTRTSTIRQRAYLDSTTRSVKTK